MSLFLLQSQKKGFYIMRTRWIVASCLAIWIALLLVSLICCRVAPEENEKVGTVRIASQKGSVDNSSTTIATPKDKLLGGLLAAGFDEKSCLSRYQSPLNSKPSPHSPSPHLLSRLRNYEALHKRCGPHSESYKKSLKRLWSGHTAAAPDCKYLVHLWMFHSGLGNRLLSLASSFLYAMLTNRILLIEQDKNMDGLLCEPFPQSSWELPSDFPLGNQFESFNGKSPHCYGNMLKNSSVAPSLDQSPPPYMYLNLIWDYDEYDKHFFCDNDQNLIQEVPWLILRSDQYFIPSLFLIPSFEQELFRLFPQRETVFHHLGRYLFHPSNHVWGLVTRYYQAYLAKADERIGIQIRDYSSTNLPFQSLKDYIVKYYVPHLATNDVTVSDSYDISSPITHMMDRIHDCSVKNNLLPKVTNITRESIVNSSKNPKSSKAVLVTSLNSRYSENLRNMYWENPTDNGKVIGVYQPSHEEFQQKGNPSHNVKALSEIYLLSQMDELITSPWSTFGYVAQGLGGVRPWILSNLQKEMASNQPPCRQAMSMEPCFHLPPFYDCKAKTGADMGAKAPYVRHCEDTSWGLKLFDDR